MVSLAKLLALSPTERDLIIETALLITKARVEVLIVGLRRVTESIDALDPPAATEAQPDRQEAVSRAIHRVAAKLPWCRNCLAQAIAGKRLLNRRGIPSTLHLGVASGSSPGAFEAHAWLESHGRLVTVSSGEDFEILFSK